MERMLQKQSICSHPFLIFELRKCSFQNVKSWFKTFIHRLICFIFFAEENEFILYATRYSIHRYDLSSGLTEDLPLTGLRGAVALDFDYSHNCLYWADVTLEIIQVRDFCALC